MEVWMKIKGFDNYEVSNLGVVRNANTGRIIKQRSTKTGYKLVDLHDSCYVSTKYVHRLVAETFITNIDNFPQVNHKDENKQNNSVDNLEWCTASYNLSYNGRAKRVGLHHRENSPTNKSIKCIDTGKVFRSVSEAARETNINRMSISYALSGKQKHAGGYSWAVV